MKRCTVFRLNNLGVSGFGCQAQRWASYDKASLTKDALLQKVEASLGEDVDGKQLKIDTDAKTITTAAGDLPISPLFDPAWMNARRQAGKAESGPPTGRFRRKLANNPFARSLATPIRKCPNTLVSLPRYFLQDFELVKHPDTGAAWWAPGPLSFEFLQPTKRPDEPQDETKSPLAETTTSDEADSSDRRPRRGPVTAYTLCRKTIVDLVGGPNRKYAAMLTAVRTGMAMAGETRNTVWRQDMGDVLLQMMRRQAVDALITRGNKPHEPKDRFIKACANWDAVKDVKLRGCVLWLPEKRDAAGQYATFDVEGVQYGKKMAVHNLFWLLGEEEVQRLRDSAPMFRDNDILVLTQWASNSMMRLHMLLWRLQGYLATPSSS
ncbi:hypothetical protein PT974_04389 [Cladobotryum mycophilum]|uniref:Uncharacterized protein n=1 Tax=Cladobotryum mycophilum TaxID=491253 RepID=A0ABR0SV19_9HYPO